MNKTRDIKQYVEVLNFSRIELAFVSAILILTPLISLVPSLYRNTGFESYFQYLEQNPSGNDVYLQYQDLSTRINTSEFAADVAVFVVWAVIGLVGYAIVMAVISFFQKTREFTEELTYEHTNKQSVLRQTLIGLGVRCLGILLLVMCSIFLSYVASFLFVSASRIVSAGSWDIGVVLGGLAFIIGTVAYCHLLVIGLRIVTLRRRLFF